MLQTVSETQIVHACQRALVALYPILRELDCIENDTQHYDPFDRIAETLWDELVVTSFQWKYGLETPPVLSPYGFSNVPPGADGYIQVRSISGDFRFIGFTGDRSFGPDPFNAAVAVDANGSITHIRHSEVDSFSWQRTSGDT